MIGQALGWNYVERIVDRGFFEDQLVQHEVTGLRAVRRLFSSNFCGDDLAVGTVRRQVEKAATVLHPAIPAVLHVEEEGNQIALYYEYVTGLAFEKMSRERAFVQPKSWGIHGLAIVRLLLSLRSLGLGYDRLLLEDLVLVDGVVRIRNRWPIGDVDESETGGSPFLERMAKSPYGGIYTVEKRHPHAVALNRLKNLLFFMASAQWEQNVSAMIEKHLAEKATGKNVNMTPLGLEYEIEDVLMRLHDPASERGLKSLEELEHALSLLAGGVKSDRSQTNWGKASPSRSEPTRESLVAPAPGSEWESSGEIPMQEIAPLRDRAAEYARASAEAARIDRTEDSVPKLDAKSDTGTGNKPLPQEAVEDEDEEEDRSYLYPSRPSAGSTSAIAKPKSPLDLVAPSRRVTKPVRQPVHWGFWIKIIGGIAFTLAVLIGGAIGVRLLMLQQPNRAPVARFTHTPEPLHVLQMIELDASGSRDPDGDELTYSWRVLDLSRSDHLIRPNRNAEAVQATLQFFISGEYTVELTVFDGALISDPVRVTLAVESERPR